MVVIILANNLTSFCHIYGCAWVYEIGPATPGQDVDRQTKISRQNSFHSENKPKLFQLKFQTREKNSSTRKKKLFRNVFLSSWSWISSFQTFLWSPFRSFKRKFLWWLGNCCSGVVGGADAWHFMGQRFSTRHLTSSHQAFIALQWLDENKKDTIEIIIVIIKSCCSS